MDDILENELLAYCLSHARHVASAQAEVTETLTGLSIERRLAVTEAIAQVLRDEAPAGNVTLRSIPVPQSPSDEFSAILHRRKRDGEVTEITLFGIRDALIAGILPLFGLILATAAGGPLGLPVPFASLAYALWSKLRILRRPEDADAIDVLEVIAADRNAGIREWKSGGVLRSQIVAELENIPDLRVIKALEKLYNRHIIKVTRWGGQAEDLPDPHNAWSVRL
jgi:hypothetical protein